MKNKKKKHRWFLSVVEEAVLNPDYSQFSGGRIEVFDNESDYPYQVYEARFLIPNELMEKFRETFDFKEVDDLPFIKFDYNKNER